MSYNFPVMEELVTAVQSEFPDQYILIGGHALQFSEDSTISNTFEKKYKNLSCVETLSDLEQVIEENS